MSDGVCVMTRGGIVIVVAGVFLLAKLHLARPGLPKAIPGEKIQLGDFYNGQTVFNQSCSPCHGQRRRDGDGLQLDRRAGQGIRPLRNQLERDVEGAGGPHLHGLPVR